MKKIFDSTFFLRFVSKRCVLSFALLVHILPVTAQRLNVNFSEFEDYYRRKQLLGKVDSSFSFAIRPLELEELESHNLRDSIGSPENLLYRIIDKKGIIGILPIHLYQQYNSNPFQAWNNGLMIATRGYQTMFSAGAFAKLGPVTIQLRPEAVFAENKDNRLDRLVYGLIDLPVRQGGKPISSLNWGQSSISLKLKPITISLSNENLWNGPGIRNSLMMSNNAQGFKHVTLSTSHPVRTAIGSIEGQILAGRLEGSGVDLTLPKDWRYLSGFLFSYQPKWIPGLFLGMSRSFQMYSKDIDGSFGDIFPFFQAFQKVNTDEDSKPRDQLISVFGRLLMPAAKGEIYFEYGLADHSYNVRDFVMSPDHSRAYLFGVKKLIPFMNSDEEFIEVAAEVTKMEQSLDRSLRTAGEWYTHSQVVHGYTHRGEVLGAGIGPSGNLQSIGLSWITGLRKIGIQLERMEFNGDLAGRQGYSPWIDFSMATNTTWTFNKVTVNGKLQGIQSVNYKWNDGLSGRNKQNIFQVNAGLGIIYSF